MRRQIQFSLLLFTLLFIAVVNAQQLQYSEVQVKLQSFTDVQSLAIEGFDIDHYQGNWEEGIRFMVTQEELQKLYDLGHDVTVTIANYESYYQHLLTQDIAANPNPTKTEFVAAGFDLGSMGGFYTNDEVIAKLDEMRTDFPNLISERVSIGITVEGRDIWMVKISDNPDIDENEPAAHFDALHHAREPLSMATTVNYMFYLLENYATDPYVKNLVDNREIYFVPVVNPDGYVFNETTNPNGGGLWRKNRNPNTGGCAGVDLNRNYAFGYANNGSCSSEDPCSGTYRGTEPFSEEESKAIRDLIAQSGANTAFSTHSTAGTYLMPYGYDTSPPAFDIYSEWASVFAADNDYSYGVTFQMLGYTSCGTTRDYMHSEGVYGWTPEIAGAGFWPPPSTIFDLVAENVRPFLFQTYIAGAYLDVQSYSIIGDVVPGETFELAVAVKNIGVGSTAEEVSVIVSADNPNVISPTAGGFGDIAPREIIDNVAVPFEFSVLPEIENGSFSITITTIHDGVANETITIPVIVGQREILFSDNGEATASNWTAYGNGTISWGINTDDSFSGLQCFGDSNDGNGENDTETFFELNEVFNLQPFAAPRITFPYKHSLPEPDRVELQISDDNGVSWEILESFTQNKEWTVFTQSLSNYSDSESVKFRFRLNNSFTKPGDGFYFDDFEISNYISDLLSVNETGTVEVSVVPNPFTSQIEISLLENSDTTTIAIYNQLGSAMKIAEVRNGNTVTLRNLNRLSSGLYFLVITDETENRRTIKRIVKE